MTRTLITPAIIESFMQTVGKKLTRHCTITLTGGATALLFQIRDGTIDIDISGDLDDLFKHLPALKEDLRINIELAKPTDFVPSLKGEESRHLLIGNYGRVTFKHFDPYAQAFSKIVRGHATDLVDVAGLAALGLVDLSALPKMVTQIPNKIFARYPRLNRPSVEQAVREYCLHAVRKKNES
jgi:hypothetical protein